MTVQKELNQQSYSLLAKIKERGCTQGHYVRAYIQRVEPFDPFLCPRT